MSAAPQVSLSSIAPPKVDGFLRQLSPAPRPSTPACDRDDDSETEHAYNAWQLVLEQACRETLRELARNAAEPEAGHGAQSIECIVRNVSERVLQEAVVCTLPQTQSPKKETSNCPPKKLLEDVTATPWVIWKECRRHRPNRIQVSPTPSDDEAETPKWMARRGSTTIVQPVKVVNECAATKAPALTAIEAGSTASTSAGGSAHESHPSTVVASSITRDNPEAVDEGRFQIPAPRRQVSTNSGLSDSEADLSERPNFRASSKELRRVATDPGEALCDLVMQTPDERPMSWDEDTFRPPPRTPNRRLSGESMVFGRMGTDMEEAPNVVRRGLTLESNASHQLLMQWRTRPRCCLIVAKKDDKIVLATIQDMAAWLSSQGILVVLEPQLLKDHPQLKQRLHGVRTFSTSDRLEKSIDLVITVGGDGTLTWAVSLFRRAMPPVLAFAAGSLGFLTPFPLDSWIRTFTNLLDLHCVRMPQRLVCRMRLRVTIYKRGQDEKFKEVQCLNEVLVHRGNSGSLVKLDVGVDGEKVTLVQGDGLILATPTGSTAYSLAAGGSMVHPSVPGILLTPVSPHSLSFRPALLPDSAVISVAVPLTARCGAAISVDGKDLCMLKIGDTVEVAMSPHPVPTICHTNETKDWFSSVQDGLQWNGRVEQKAK